MIAPATTPGTLSGQTIRVKISQLLAPRSRALSMMDVGMRSRLA